MNASHQFTVSTLLFVGTAMAITVGAAVGTELSVADRDFIIRAAQASHAEVAAGKVVALKSTNNDVLSFASQMVADHTTAGDELKELAQRKGMALPMESDTSHRALEARLDAASVSAVDRLYIAEAGLKDHQAAIELFTDEANNGNDPDLKAFAARTLPAIKRHYEMAQSLASKIR